MDRITSPLVRVVLPAVLRASTTHLGGTATQTFLRSALVDRQHITADTFNRCFAVARLTPGTNLLAFYAALGYHAGRWRGAIACLTVGTVVPSCISLAVGVLYARYAASSPVDRLMAGAQAGAVAVLFGTAVRLLVTTCAERPVHGGAIALAVMLAVWSGLFPPVLILLLGATAGGIVLGGDR